MTDQPSNDADEIESPDIRRLAALRDSGQISVDDFERLKREILAAAPDETTAPPFATPASEFPPNLPAGREKPVRAVRQQAGTPWEPATELGRDPEVPFEPGASSSEDPPMQHGEVSTGVPVPAPVDEGGSPPPPPAPPGPFERYPLRYGVLYPEGLSRWKTAFRIVFLVPLFIFRYLIDYALGALALVGWTSVFWRKKYPSWAFRGVAGILEYQARFTAYALLQTDKFPSLDRDESRVRLDLADPPPGQLSRWRVLFWKLILLVPHFIVLTVLTLALFVVSVLAWFGILFTGNYPRGMFGFASGVTRWYLRVTAYFLSLNDRFPPFALSDDAGAAGRGATVASGVIGALAAGGLAGGIAAVVLLSGQTHHEDVSYAALQQGHVNTIALDTVNGGYLISLTGVDDPGDDLVRALPLAEGERIVVFHWKIANLSDATARVAAGGADLTVRVDDDGDVQTHDYAAQFVTVGDRVAPQSIGRLTTASVQAVFIVPDSAEPMELHFYNGFAGRGGITYRFQ